MRRGATMRPEDVPRGRHKEYARMPLLALPDPTPLPTTLAEAIQKRHSFEQAIVDKPFTKEALGTLLGLSLRARSKKPHRHYPSGGALFPIETYLIGRVLEKLPPAVFHYNPTAHALEQLWNLPDDFSMSNMIRASGTPLAETLLVFTAVWDRSSKKYGDLSYSHGLIEAGHMAQNILLVATAQGIQSRPVAGCDDAYLTDLLDLDKETEQFVYGVLLSPLQTRPQL